MNKILIKSFNNSFLINEQNLDTNLFDFNLSDSDYYLYFIPIVNPSYFHDNKDLGFFEVDNNTKKDIRNGKCFLVLYATDEGMFGSEDNSELEILEKWIADEQFPKYSVHFICMNLIIKESISKKNLNIVGHPNVYNSETYLKPISLLETPYFYDIGLNSEFKLFLNYNRNLRFNYRAYLLLNLIKNNLENSGLISFSQKLQDGLMEWLHTHLQEFKFDEWVIKRFNDIVPLKINNLTTDDSTMTVDANFLGQEIVIDDYKNTFLSLVSESLVLKDTIYFSEKTFKPIMIGHPFMLISSPNSLKKLKELGYKTFDKWWDESYDSCDEYYDRIEMITSELIKLNKKSKEELIQIRKDMIPILNHNQKLYQTRIRMSNPLSDIFKNIYSQLLNRK